MARTLSKAKGRRDEGLFITIPCRVLESQNYRQLSAKGTRLLLDMCSQLRFKRGGEANNGDLSATLSTLRGYGWNSNECLRHAISELLHYGLIQKTRQGGRNRCSLYAVTWLAIDECGGKLDVSATRVASGKWKDEKPKWKRPRRNTKSLGRFCNSTRPYTGSVRNSVP